MWCLFPESTSLPSYMPPPPSPLPRNPGSVITWKVHILLQLAENGYKLKYATVQKYICHVICDVTLTGPFFYGRGGVFLPPFAFDFNDWYQGYIIISITVKSNYLNYVSDCIRLPAQRYLQNVSWHRYHGELASY